MFAYVPLGAVGPDVFTPAQLLEELGDHLIDAHLPPPGTRTQGVEAGYMANAWVRLQHPDYDGLRGLLDRVGETLKVRAH